MNKEGKGDVTMEQQILDAAEELFLNKGFALASTTEISRKAGCNQALVHYYFRTKDNLFETIFEKKMRVVISSFQEWVKKDISFDEKLTRLIESHFDMLQANPKIPFFLINELTVNPDRISSIKERVIGEFRDVVSQLDKELQAEIKKGKIRPVELTDLLLSMGFLNATLFLFAPVFTHLAELSEDELNRLIQHRKKEHVHVILASLRPIK